MRDEFTAAVRNILAARAGHQCSNPDCMAPTSGPRVDANKAVNLGVAAHITAASPRGPRYDETLSSSQRADADNGVWLCQNCAKLIDNDPERFSVHVLHSWRLRAEQHASRSVGKARPSAAHQTPDQEDEIKRKLSLKRDLAKLFLRAPTDPKRRAGRYPYSKFRVTRFIVRSLDDVAYPEVDESPGISSWLRFEPYDFYHNGIEVILNLTSGAVDDAGRWRLIPYDSTPRQPFRRIKVWVIGRIPFAYIRAYDPDGDEYYREPHLYCAYANDGEPYEEIRFAVCSGDDGYDRPLDPGRRLGEADEGEA